MNIHKTKIHKSIILATLLTAGMSHGSTTLIDVTFPGGTGTNPTFNGFSNNVGTNSWTQSTGVLSTSTSNNSTMAAISANATDFTSLGSDSLVMTTRVTSADGTLAANGNFIGFQQSSGLWNNDQPSFGLIIGGSASVGGLLNVGVGGLASVGGKYIGVNYGTTTAGSMSSGFDVILTLSSSGWDVAITGLEDSGGAAITGGSGTWGGAIGEFSDFNNDMRVGTSYQTSAAAGDLTLSQITLTQVAAVPEPSSTALLGLGGLALILRRRK